MIPDSDNFIDDKVSLCLELKTFKTSSVYMEEIFLRSMGLRLFRAPSSWITPVFSQPISAVLERYSNWAAAKRKLCKKYSAIGDSD